MNSKCTQEMTSFIVMDVLERAHELERQGAHIIHLEVGEPDFDHSTQMRCSIASAASGRPARS